MKRYAAYKPTGLKWFPEIPQEWNWRFLCQVAQEQTIKKPPEEMYPVMTLSYGEIKRKKNIDSGLVPSNYDNYQMLYKGNIVLRLIDLQNDHTSLRTGLVHETGIITPAYTCIVSSENPAYIRYLLHSYDTRKVFYGYGGGVRQSIGFKEIRHLQVSVPPRDEQDQIVRYLDWQVSKINRLIAAKRKQIELLNQTIAYNLERIICEGIHGEELVETGNPWISTAPKSWNKLRHKNILTEKKIVVGDTYSQYTLLSLTTKGIIVRDISSGKGKFPSDFSTYQVVQPSDMVFCLFDVDETPRTVGLSAYTGMITGAYTVYETHDVLPEFLLHYFTAIDNKKGFKPLYSGLRKVIGKDVFSRQSIYLPSVKEQKEIVAAIDASQKKCKKAMDLFEQEIIALTDLRTHLISDVVTGQIDVRGIEVPTFEYIDESNNNDENTEEMEAELDG